MFCGVTNVRKLALRIAKRFFLHIISAMLNVLITFVRLFMERNFILQLCWRYKDGESVCSEAS